MILKKTTKNTPLQFCNTTVQPGEHVTMALPMPELYSYSPTYMPIHIIHGKQEGPCLLICAAIHGDEVNGVEIIQRLLKLSLLKKIKGTLIAVPVVNVYGLINRTRTLPDGRDLNVNFPGSESGSLTSRLAHLFVNEILDKADYCIDIHSGRLNRTHFPQVQATLSEPGLQKLAAAFQVPVIVDVKQPEEGSLQAVAASKHIPLLTYEAGEAMRFDEFSVRKGIKGIVHMMREIEMLPKTKTTSTKKTNGFHPIISHSVDWVWAPCSGIVQVVKNLGDQVDEGDCLAIISDPFGSNKAYKVLAPETGIVIGQNNLPLVNEGEPLFRIAKVNVSDTAAEQVTEWQEQSEALR